MSPRNLIVIPKGSKAVPCKSKSCSIPIYWIPHPTTQKKHPVSASPEGCYAPTDTEDGIGVSHFSDCVDAHTFRKRPTTPTTEPTA